MCKGAQERGPNRMGLRHQAYLDCKGGWGGGEQEASAKAEGTGRPTPRLGDILASSHSPDEERPYTLSFNIFSSSPVGQEGLECSCCLTLLLFGSLRNLPRH